ncbi:MAG: DUF362 domain-containing protein [Desulfobacterales bacterium]|nr:DUF362 domain-containing protein [Desulfobacterales bacterium]
MDPDTSQSRRDFLIRSAKAGLSVAAAGAIGYLFYDPNPPDGSAATEEDVRLPDFSVSGTAGRISIVTGPDRLKTVQLGLRSIGGIEAFIKRGDRVLLKVNAAFASPPFLGATTHPVLVSELTRLCFKAGAASVTVTDNPINDPDSCFRLTGIMQAATSAGARLFLPRESFFRPVTVKGGDLIRHWPLLHEPFQGINKLIGLAPVKDHHRSGASMTMKNWYGLLGGRRNIFHQDIHNFIKELSLMVTPTLVILDGTASMMTNGPTGGTLDDLKPTHTMIVSTDQVAADAVGAGLLGRRVEELSFIGKAAAAGAGTAAFESLNPVRVSIG